MSRRSPFTPRRRTDLKAIATALVLLAVIGLWWLHLSHTVRRQRAEVLARVPAFPRRSAPLPAPRVAHATPAPKPAPAPKPKLDPMKQFVLNALHSEDVVALHVNALVNTPLFAHLDKCLALGQSGDGSSFDPTRDIDQLASTNLGTVMTGFFDSGTPPVPTCASPQPQGSYRGFTLSSCGDSFYAQQSSAFIESSGMQVRGMVDDTLDPPPADADPDAIYGDIYGHWNLNDLDPNEPTDTTDQLLVGVLTRLSTLTIRANVWDNAALSIEGDPRSGESADDLAAAAAGALSLLRGQVDDNDVRLSALAELAAVHDDGGKVRVDVALPTEALVDRLNDLCAREMQPPPVLAPDAGAAASAPPDGATEDAPE